MNGKLFLASVGVLLLAVGAKVIEPRLDGASQKDPGILKAAVGVLESFDAEQVKDGVFRFDDEERFRWHFIPRVRKGVALKRLTDEQRDQVKELLRTGLSELGYGKARQVMSLEGILRELEGPGGANVRDPLLYYLAFFGRPSADADWGWRFEGHHLSLNFTLRGPRLVSATPSFFGSNPAIVREGPEKGLRVLADVEDVARKLIQSLDPGQLAACTGDPNVPREVPDTEKARYTGPYPSGVTQAKLNDDQREILRELVKAYTRKLEPTVARSIEQAFGKERPEDVHFAWRGGREAFTPHSYLVHGKSFVVNYSNEQNGGAHVHSSLRTRTSDFGLAGLDSR